MYVQLLVPAKDNEGIFINNYFKGSHGQLIVQKATKSDHLANYLDLTFIKDSGGKLSTRPYGKCDDFD